MTQITIPSEVPKVSYTVGATPQTVFTFDFGYFDDADLLVYDDGVLVSSFDYTVTPAVTYDNGYDGGTVTLTTAVSNATIVITRSVAVERTSNFALSGPFAIAALNTQFSRLVAMIQDRNPGIQQTVKYSLGVTDTVGEITETAADRALKLIGYDVAGSVALYAPVDAGLFTPSAFMTTMLDDADAATARTTLELENGSTIKHNLTATAAPGVNDDSTAGYSVNSIWSDVTNDKMYFCIDATAGAAIWQGPLGTGGGLFKGNNGTIGTDPTGAGDIFRVNAQSLTGNVTIDADENASCAGPLTVNSGIVLTVSGNLSIV